MAAQTVVRFLKIVGGFTCLFLGIILVFTPGPGWAVIVVGLGLLGTEFAWAQRLLDRMKDTGLRLRNAILPKRAPKMSEAVGSPAAHHEAAESTHEVVAVLSATQPPSA